MPEDFPSAPSALGHDGAQRVEGGGGVFGH